MIKDGFDGIYLDWVGAFENTAIINAAQNDGKDPAEEMISFIKKMRAYAISRNPDFLIIQQNASALCEGHSELFNIIDAIAQEEEVWYGGDATDDWDDPLGYAFIIDQSQSEEYFHYLDQYLSVGLPFFNCEYALNYSDSAYAKEYIPFVTRRSLSKLITIPPPDILSAINSHEEDDDNLPTEYALFQNYPNPFNHSTTIKYSIAKFPLLGRDERSSRLVGGRGLVTLKVYDILGREIATLVNKKQQASNYEVIFNANDLPSGIYFYKITTGSFVKTKKMMLLK